jgi:arsenate reductase-like glutaredoxin family protein
MQYEKKIEPTKDELRNFLKKHAMDVETLIEKSAMDNLRESFPSVFTVFEKIHDDP